MGNWWRRQQRLWSVERVQTSGSALTGSFVRHCNHQPVPAACSGSVGADSAVQQVDNSDPRSSRCVTEISSRQAHSQYLDNTVSRQYRYLRGPEIWILQPSMFEKKFQLLYNDPLVTLPFLSFTLTVHHESGL